jgi:hypothetical protein
VIPEGNVLSFPCPEICSIPKNCTRLRAEVPRNVVTIAELGVENKEAREGCIAGVDEEGEEITGVFVDGERMGLEDDLHGTIDNGEDNVNHSNARCSNPLPLQKQGFRWRSDCKVTLPFVTSH